MARTKASVGAKVSSTKSSKVRTSAPPPPSPRAGGSGGGSTRSSTSGGNPVCPRETPAWQLPITRFFRTDERPDAMDTDEAGPSEAPRRRVRRAVSSDEESPGAGAAALPAGDADLPPLDGDACHKIAEYFPRLPARRASDDKENERQVRRDSAKRDLDEAEVSVSKKMKVSF